MRQPVLEAVIIIKQILLSTVLLVVFTAPVQAHFFVDDSNGSGAIVHITPDDDPIAGGAESTINFDLSSKNISIDTHFLSMEMIEPSGQRIRLSASMIDNLIIANYSFKQEGAHTVTLVATNKNTGNSTIFEHTQIVSRSLDSGSAQLNDADNTLAKVIAVWSIGGIALLVTIVSLRRQNRNQA